MQVIFELTPWRESTVTRGKYTGQACRDRLVLAADSWNWVIALQRNDENTAPVGQNYAGNTNLLCSCIENLRLDVYEFLEKQYVPMLATRTGKEVIAIDRAKGLKDIGHAIDDQYGSSFMREYPPKVRERLGLLGDDEDQNETES